MGGKGKALGEEFWKQGLYDHLFMSVFKSSRIGRRTPAVTEL